ncbi:FAD:protein FMN transferase [Planosporangium thailandense]|uniref:FAD:protein FMN transferase n=1 Tax=Planosporangium thailandense TaxID=765197 RepID=A0ABX0XVF7_9ACTN|nr:FAD:protein FMN transferase [Planosporangium thailandense]
MPPREFLPDRSGTAEWPVWDATAHVIVTAPERVVDAQALVVEQLAAIEEACSPFRRGSEVRTLEHAGGRPVRESALLAELVAVSLREAQRSDGDVLHGHEREPRRAWPRGGGTDEWQPLAPDRRSIRRNGQEITASAEALPDLRAVARAHTADRCAWSIAKRFKIGVLVGIGGDIATAGRAPDGGWRTLMKAVPGGRSLPVRLPSAALATSGTESQRWRGGGGPLPYALCPGTSRSATPMWRSVSVAAFTCAYARTLSMAALARGRTAPDWLRDLGVAARLVDTDGDVVLVGPWPADAPR